MTKSEAVMEYLNSRLSFLNSTTFYLFFSASVLFNPVAVWVQMYSAWTAPSTEGISMVTFSTMLLLQGLTIGYSIRIKEPIILIAMSLSALGTVGILLALVFR